MIVGTGIDLLEISRIQDLLDKQGDSFLAKVFSQGEREYCMAQPRPAEHLAARFAAKEATMKALGTGWTKGVGFQQIEVTRDSQGAPGIRLHKTAAQLAKELGIAKLHLSLSHSRDQAIAMVVAEQ